MMNRGGPGQAYSPEEDTCGKRRPAADSPIRQSWSGAWLEQRRFDICLGAPTLQACLASRPSDAACVMRAIWSRALSPELSAAFVSSGT